VVLNLTGRCNIKISVDIPVDTELAVPLVESCIWRQVRGSGAEIADSDGQDTTSEKVTYFHMLCDFLVLKLLQT
jgi:hypothetical protein